MTEWLSQNHKWIEAFHVISVIFWMAGMFYLPRLYVYHAEVLAGSELSENYKKMEVLLLRRIINPAMFAVFFFGGLLLWVFWDAYSSEPWLYIKLTAVLAMVTYHGFLARWRKAFDRDERPLTSRQLRILNEVPPVLTIIIVIMVVVKPF